MRCCVVWKMESVYIGSAKVDMLDGPSHSKKKMGETLRTSKTAE